MSEGQESTMRWFLGKVFVPILVVVAGAAAAYYFSDHDGASANSANGPMGTNGPERTTVPPPPAKSFPVGQEPVTIQEGRSRTSDGNVVVEPPPSMDDRH